MNQQQIPKEIPQLAQQSTNQSHKTVIYIENLDQGISEDYLYRKFKEVGEIQSLKISKDKTTQKSKGQAFITFAHPDSADEARKKFNNNVFIRNTIRVKAYFNYHIADKKANIFINNLPEDADTLELEQEFSRYGTVLSVDVHRDTQGKQLNYGYVQFEKKEDADKLIEKIAKQPITHKGKLLKLEQFKAQSERKVESSSIYLRAFAQPLSQELWNSHGQKVVRAIEFAWSLIIKEYLTNYQGDLVKDCFVKIDQFTRQPWAMISFDTPEQAKRNLEVCESNRSHPCIQSGAHIALSLLKKQGPPPNSDGSLPFSIEEVASSFEQMAKDPNDIFKGQSANFFYNMVYSKHLNPDDRLILVQNIKDDVTKEQIEEFLGEFGKVIRLTIRKTKNPRFQVQQCFVHYQTLEDSKKARSEIYDENNTQLQEKKKQIFKDGHVMMNILLSKTMRKEFKEVKKQSVSIFQNPGGRQLLQPPYPQNLLPPPFPMLPPGPQQIPRNPRQQQQQQRPYQQYPMPRMPQQNQRYPQQNRYPPGPGQQPIRPIQQPQQQPQQRNVAQDFPDYQTVQSRIEDFNKLNQQTQRQHLGNLLFARVVDVVSDPELSKRIVGMLVDPSNMDISDVINLFEDSDELKNYIDEAIGLLKEEANQQGQ